MHIVGVRKEVMSFGFYGVGGVSPILLKEKFFVFLGILWRRK